jgi:ketosteroid isomerase-like protein
MSTDTLREQIRAQVRTAVGAAKATATDASIAALMQRFEAGYAAVNAEAIVACFAPDVVWTLPDSRVLKGRAACLAFLKERFASPKGPQFSDSRMHVLGQTVVQNYKVSLPLPGGRSVTLDGTDVYRISDGLIAHKDAYWKQIGAAQPAAGVAAPTASGAATPAVVVPLRVGSAAGAQALSELYKRLAASPALLQAAQTGVLRFDLRVEEGLAQGTSAMAASSSTLAIDPAACCASCQAGKACECKGDQCGLHEHKTTDTVPELKGVIGERLLKTLPPGVKTVRLHPKAVVTPLGKEALRKRGITIDRGAHP